MDPFDLINGDCWEAVLEKLSPLDKLSLVQCHPYLKEFFEDKIGEWILLTSLSETVVRWTYQGRIDWNQTALKCRLLSRSCRSEIDGYLGYFLPPCDLCSEQKVESCIAHIESNPGRAPPLINGAIRSTYFLHNYESNIRPPTFDRVITLLATMAPAVKKVNFTVLFPTYDEASTLIRRLLSTLPNIEQVHLNLYISYRNQPLQLENNEVIQLPDLPRLVSLHITYQENHEFPSLLPCPDLSQMFTNIDSLVLPLPLWKPEYTARNLLFPNLSHIEFSCVKLGNSDDEEKVFNFFTKFNAPKLWLVSMYFSYLGLRKEEWFYFMRELIWNCLREMHPEKKCQFGNGHKNRFMMFFLTAPEETES